MIGAAADYIKENFHAEFHLKTKIEFWSKLIECNFVNILQIFTIARAHMFAYRLNSF